MLRIVLFSTLFFTLLTQPASAAESCAYGGPHGGAQELKRGVNLSRWWEDDRRQALTKDDIANLHLMGLDFVRLPLSPKWIETEDTDARAETIAKLRCDLIDLLNQNFTVILDLHAGGTFVQEIAEAGDKGAERLTRIWTLLQPAIADLPADRLSLSLLNEPKMDDELWWRIQEQSLKDLRKIYPHNRFVATAAPDGGPWSLEPHDAYDDKNILYDFHFYQPMFFTHHGANWFPSSSPEFKTVKIYYPVGKDNVTDETDPDVKQYVGEEWGRPKLAGFVNKIARWGQQHGVHVACLEFGVYRPFLDARSRDNWIGDMRALLENAGIPWALWEYRGNFGLLDAEDEPDEGVEMALGLNHSHGP